MAGQFKAERVSRSTRQESCDALPEFEPNESRQPCQFVDGFQRLMGDDFEPDPLFFVECWTLGTPAAAINFQQRRQALADRELPNLASQDNYSPSTPLFLQQEDVDAQAPSAASAAASARRYYATWRQQSSEKPAVRAQDQTPPTDQTFAESCDSLQETAHPMTLKCACRLLGVTATSTLKEIKTAYRRMASRWHPDRIEFRPEPVRRLATEQMAAVNEAYHLLRSSQPQEPFGFGPD